MKKILFILIVLAVIYNRVTTPKNSTTSSGITGITTEARLQTEIDAYNQTLPKTIKDRLRIDKVELVDHVVRYKGVQLWKQDLLEKEKEDLSKYLKDYYCNGNMKKLVDAKIDVEFAFTTQPRSLNDLSTETWRSRVQASQCGIPLKS